MSDEQYIERVRKSLRTRRRWRYFMAAMTLCILGMTIWLLFLGMHFLAGVNNMGRLTGHGTPTVHEQTIYTVYCFAAMIGLAFGIMVSNALAHAMIGLFEYQKDRLLVQCWDALSDAEKVRLRQSSS